MPSKAVQYVRCDLMVTPVQKAQLEALANDTGISMSELMRRALDKYLDEASPHVVRTGRAP